MDIRQVRHFVTVAQLGSFSAAAKLLRVTQPALSKSVRNLEQMLGVRLFDRGPGGVRVTLFGERLLSYGLSDEAVAEIDALRGARRGSLHVGAMGAVLDSIVPQAVSRFQRAHPDVNIVIDEGLNDALFGSLFAGKIDIAITTRPVEVIDDSLEWRELLNEPVEFVVGADHPLAARKRIELSELVPFNWIMPPRPEPDRLTLDALFVTAGLSKPRIVIETTSRLFMSAMLRQSRYIGYRSSLARRSELLPLASLDLASDTWSRAIFATFRRKGVIRPAVLAFLQKLEESCRLTRALNSEGRVSA